MKSHEEVKNEMKRRKSNDDNEIVLDKMSCSLNVDPYVHSLSVVSSAYKEKYECRL
jgi:hypothetical protein